MGISELHTFFVYVFFGYFFIFPVVLLCLKLFDITHPRQRMGLYLLALLAPVAGFVLYHTVLSKRCQAGIYPQGLFWQAFNSFCRFGTAAIRFLGPVLIALMFLGFFKALAGALYILRTRARSVEPPSQLHALVTRVLAGQCREWGLEVPDVIFTGRAGFIACTAGFFRPVIIVSSQLAAELTEAELEGILVHELVHVRRKDTITGWLLNLLRDLMIFSPFSTVLFDRYMLERERLCDREAVVALGKPRAYAATLVKAGRLLLEHREFHPGMAVGFTGKKRDLEHRVISLLHGSEGDRELPAILFYGLVFSVSAITVIYLGFIC